MFDALRPREERDLPFPCMVCGGATVRLFPAPRVMNQARPDSYRRGDDYQVLKEAARVEKGMYNLPPEKRGEHQKEVARLKNTARSKRGKTTDRPD